MYMFLAGFAIAAVLSLGTIFLFDTTGITVTERASPSQYVRVDEESRDPAEDGVESSPTEERKTVQR